MPPQIPLGQLPLPGRPSISLLGLAISRSERRGSIEYLGYWHLRVLDHCIPAKTVRYCCYHAIQCTLGRFQRVALAQMARCGLYSYLGAPKDTTRLHDYFSTLYLPSHNFVRSVHKCRYTPEASRANSLIQTLDILSGINMEIYERVGDDSKPTLLNLYILGLAR